jgi:hypothetical protein
LAVTISFTLSGASVGSKRRTIPHSGNARLHWAQRAKWNNSWKEQTGWAAKKAIWDTIAYGFVDLSVKSLITITLHTCRLLDADNAHACVKPIVDGLKGILIADDSPEHITLTVKQKKVSKRAEECVEVEVRSVGEGMEAA